MKRYDKMDNHLTGPKWFGRYSVLVILWIAVLAGGTFLPAVHVSGAEPDRKPPCEIRVKCETVSAKAYNDGFDCSRYYFYPDFFVFYLLCNFQPQGIAACTE